MLVFAAALMVRIVFALATADSYDPDEFVILTLSRDFAHGAVPYQGFTFFHPPGVLVLFRILQPLVNIWWPLGRGVTMLLDSCTAVLVWWIAARVFDRRRAMAAGLLYALNPISVLASVHIGQDTLLTAIAVGGLALLVPASRGVDERATGTRTERGKTLAALAAGSLLGLAFWFKYPALIFLPVYLVLARDRIPQLLLGLLLSITVLFGIFWPQLGSMAAQSIGWQMIHRDANDPLHRISGVLAFWLLLNPLAGLTAYRWLRSGVTRKLDAIPPWLVLGFALGGLFVFSAQVYYHYFVPIIPFAALLSAPLVVRLWDGRRGLGDRWNQALHRMARLAMPVGILGLLALWAGAADIAAARNGLALLSFSQLNVALRTLNSLAPSGHPVLVDAFEYAYLDHRPLTSPYFWNLSEVTTARTLEEKLGGASAVVSSTQDGYPNGFTQYLRLRGYREVITPAATIWVK